jgi:CAAX protease family protein
VNSVLRFFVLTYALTWSCFFSVIELSSRSAPAAVRGPLLYLGVFAPSLVAIGLARLAEGRAGVRRLLSGLFRWQVGARWYLFAAGSMAAIKLLAALVHRITLGGWPRFGNEPWFIMLAAMLVSTPIQAGEEIGWRGYSPPRLAARLGLGWASVLLGVIWACWHLPLFFFPAADTYGQSFPVYLLQVTAISVAMAWLYARTNGSLLLAMLMHAAINNTKDIVPSALPGAANAFSLHASPVAWITVALLWVAAGYFLFHMRRQKSEVSS